MVKGKKNLQSAIERLEEIVGELNGKEIDVDAGLEKFKEGVDLIKFCKGKLRNAENEFNRLKRELDSEGDISE